MRPVLTGIECFQKAIAIDPGFALAHAGYADANLLIASYGLLPPKQIRAQAKHSAERALHLNPSLCEPYCSLGYYHTCFEWNWAEAKKNFLKSIELNPRYAEGHFRYAWNYLTCVEGNFDEAEKHAKIAITLEPLSSLCYAVYSLILHCAGKFKESLAVCKTGIDMDSSSFLCHTSAGSTYMALEQYEEAFASFEAAMKLSQRKDFFTVHAFIWMHCLTGHPDKAAKVMDEIKLRSQTEYTAKTFLALSAAYLNNIDEAFDYLEQAYTERDPILLMLKYEHWVPTSLRNDQRFENLLERIGFQ